MMEKDYRAAFEHAKTDLAKAMETRSKALEQADKAHLDSVCLRRAVTALAAICGENIEESMGLTEAVRTIFHGNTAWRNLTQIKTQVEALGASLADLKNPDASVMSALSRLANAGELQLGSQKIRIGKNATDQKVWRTAPEPDPEPDPLTEDDIPF